MANKKGLLSFITIAEYITLISATVAVLLFQFLPYFVCIMVALSCYVAGFGFASVRAILNCIEIFTASKLVSGENQALVATNSVEVLSSKKERVWAVVTSILWLLLLAFSIVVLVLYPKVF